MDGLGAPDQGADQRPNKLLGLLVEIIPTFSPLISTYTLTLIFDFNTFTFICPITD
jgi:hypothetical protein